MGGKKREREVGRVGKREEGKREGEGRRVQK